MNLPGFPRDADVALEVESGIPLHHHQHHHHQHHYLPHRKETQ